MSNYATKSHLKNATDVDALHLASLKSDIDKLEIDKLKKVPSGGNNLKLKVDELDVDKLVPVPFSLSKLS